MFEIVHKDLADHAIAEHVEIAKIMCGEHTVGFINGVLRNLIRQREAGTMPVPPLPEGDIPRDPGCAQCLPTICSVCAPAHGNGC